MCTSEAKTLICMPEGLIMSVRRDSPEEAAAEEALLRRLQEEAAMCRELLEVSPKP